MSSSQRAGFSMGSAAFYIGRARARGARWIVLLALGAAGFVPPAAAASFDALLNATPLVLKDGRIAEVLVHAIPFPDDAVAPSSTIQSQLESFTQSIATDCFLTAQVIGHVDKREISGRETADIHRLARARADTIQSSLVGNGLPATSIASVWDWRFMVQQARVTLWVFRLTAGEDCENAPLGQQTEDLVADASRTTESLATADAGPAGGVAPDPAPKTPAPAAMQHQIIPAAKPKTSDARAAAPSTAEAASAKQAPLPAAPAKAQTEGAVQTAALGSAHEKVDLKGSTTLADNGALEIVFATNSSYFPDGAGERLRAFMKALDKGRDYVLRIRTSVDSAAGVNGVTSKEEAERYNAWLAERRFKRVEAWLLKNRDGRSFTIEPSLIENDGSRRVSIEPSPLG
jgi:outer membrane protein OmpA-like peptidoglycan-associated protein